MHANKLLSPSSDDAAQIEMESVQKLIGVWQARHTPKSHRKEVTPYLTSSQSLKCAFKLTCIAESSRENNALEIIYCDLHVQKILHCHIPNFKTYTEKGCCHLSITIGTFFSNNSYTRSWNQNFTLNIAKN
jgi:hypothetical protein